jgi:hypothetical protein
MTPPPATVPDIRSLFLGWYYNFAKLPEEPMRPRVADDRIGYFGTWRFDYTNDNALTPRVNYINRWRLEKTDRARRCRSRSSRSSSGSTRTFRSATGRP